MYEPERSLEPPEPRVLHECEGCGADICVGDTFYRIPPYWECYCENCVSGWEETAEED